MRLAVFTGQYFWFDGERYSTDEAFVNFVTSFYPYFEKIIFCDAVIRDWKREAYLLDETKTEVCPLPYFSVYSFWKNILVIFPKIYRVIGNNIRDWDIVWLPAPHPVSLLFAYICRKQRKPFFLVVRQNLMEQVRHRNKGIKRSCAMAAVGVIDYICQKLAEKNLTFTVGREMYDVYKRRGKEVYEIGVSLISENDIEETLRTRSSEPQGPVKLLSVGRLDPEKGLHFLIEAVEELVKKRRLDVVLRIVGKGLKGGEEKKLRQEVEKRLLTRNIRFLGYVAFGAQLLTLYRDSDIFVLPSLTGEGVPQTLFEAMACGTPIVATRVAGIPYIIQNGETGLLIDPGSRTELCEAVERLITDAKLRYRLTRNCLSAVRSHTLEAERDRMIYRIQDFLEQVGI